MKTPRSNPVAVSFRPTHYGLGVYVNGRCIDDRAMTFEQAEEAAYDHLVGVLGIEGPAASRLVRRATRQEAKREGARVDAMSKRYRTNPSASDYRVTVLYPSGAKRSYTSEHRLFGGPKPSEIAIDEARKGANGTIIEVREAHVGRPGSLLYRYVVVGYGVVKNAPKTTEAKMKRNPATSTHAPLNVKRAIVQLRHVEKDAREAWENANRMGDVAGERKYRQQFNDAKSRRESLERLTKLSQDQYAQWGKTYDLFDKYGVRSGVHDDEHRRRTKAARDVKRDAGRMIARLLSTRKKRNPYEKVGHRTPKQASMKAIASGKYDRLRHWLDGVRSQAYAGRMGELQGREDRTGYRARQMEQMRDIARREGAKEAEVEKAERLGIEQANARWAAR